MDSLRVTAGHGQIIRVSSYRGQSRNGVSMCMLSLILMPMLVAEDWTILLTVFRIAIMRMNMTRPVRMHMLVGMSMDVEMLMVLRMDFPLGMTMARAISMHMLVGWCLCLVQ